MGCDKACKRKGKNLYRKYDFDYCHSSEFMCGDVHAYVEGGCFFRNSLHFSVSIFVCLAGVCPFCRWNAFYVTHQSLHVFVFVFSQHKRRDLLLWLVLLDIYTHDLSLSLPLSLARSRMNNIHFYLFIQYIYVLFHSIFSRNHYNEMVYFVYRWYNIGDWIAYRAYANFFLWFHLSQYRGFPFLFSVSIR